MKWLVLIVFGGLGLAALTGGLAWAKKRYDLTEHGVLTQGTVVGQQEEQSTTTRGRSHTYTETRTSYYPIVEYTGADGEPLRVTGSSGGVGSEPIPFEPGPEVVGKTTKVYVDPGDDKRYLVEVVAVLGKGR
jgi:hypothetical protein